MTDQGAPGFFAGSEVVQALWSALPEVSTRTVAAVVGEVSEYTSQLSGTELRTLEQAVHQALAAFLRRATRPSDVDEGAAAAGLDAAYLLGRGEARAGRAMDPLLAAYRVGARSSWREWVAVLDGHGASAVDVGEFAALVFTYVDELSASSVAGHADELAASGRVREKQLERLALGLLGGEPTERLTALADAASWAPPETLTVVLVPTPQVRGALAGLDARTLAVSAELTSAALPDDTTLLLVPDVRRGRAALVEALGGGVGGSGGVPVVVGPARPWSAVGTSARRVEQAVASVVPAGVATVIDTEEHLVEILLGSDPEALADLRARALAPLAGRRSTSSDRLAETLRAWLLLQGRREEVAAHLHVHPQTVRYRMGQIREAYGDLLSAPDFVLQLLVALAVPPSAAAAGLTL